MFTDDSKVETEAELPIFWPNHNLILKHRIFTFCSKYIYKRECLASSLFPTFIYKWNIFNQNILVIAGSKSAIRALSFHFLIYVSSKYVYLYLNWPLEMCRSRSFRFRIIQALISGIEIAVISSRVAVTVGRPLKLIPTTDIRTIICQSNFNK